MEIAKGMDTEGPTIVPPTCQGSEQSISAENPESSLMFRQLVFLKYGTTFRELIWKIDIENDPRAHQQLMAVRRDYWKLLT